MNPQEAAEPLRYYRSRNGIKVHRADCRHARNGVPWHYADGFTAEQIRRVLAAQPWLKPCGACGPEVER